MRQKDKIIALGDFGENQSLKDAKPLLFSARLLRRPGLALFFLALEQSFYAASGLWP
ncbi:MAG: hypothetical protein OEV92_11490 [Nitrospinota bacterium]|nr:hypothetical protein [Nitrospinota bacterium]